MLYHYSRWDGTQEPFDISPDEVMEELSQDLLSHGDIQRALRRLMQRGMPNKTSDRFQGLRGLMERLKAQRQQRLQRYNLDSAMDDIRQRLDKIVQTERQGINRRLQEAPGQQPGDPTQQAQSQPGEEGQPQDSQGQPGGEGSFQKMLQDLASKKLSFLDKLPPDPAGRIKELSDYEFMDEEARRMFQELMDMLKQQMMNSLVKDMSQRLQSMTPEQMAALRQMLQDLNQMLREQMQGGSPNFQQFMEQYGSMFGPNPPQSLEELMQRMQSQMAQMQSLLDSMSPQARQELEDLMDSLLDDETRAQLAELAANMESLYPMEDLRREYPFTGEDSLSLQEAMRLMDNLQQMDKLEEQIKGIQTPEDLDKLDAAKVEELLGEEARRNLEALKRIAKELEEAGYLRRKGDKLELTPRGIRKIGQKVLRDIFDRLKQDRLGRHEVYKTGTGSENEGTSRKYEFGDPFLIDLQKTLMNSVVRRGSGVPVRLKPDDFEIYRTENLSKASTVLLLDQSRSMGLYGSFLAAKKVAIALYTLITTQFPNDNFYIVGFSDMAVELKGEHLPEVTWSSWVSGTNMHHAFMLSRELLSKHKGGTKQIIMITDGEPTAHLGNGYPYFSYPPSYRTIQETLKEVKRCTRAGIVINTFMLETSYFLIDFINQLTKINRGRAFCTTPDKLGEYVMVDYIHNRKKRVA